MTEWRKAVPTVMMILGFGTLIVRSGKLRSKVEMDSVVSKESVFLFNNLFFLVAGLTVFLGTLYPLLVETLKGMKVTVGPPYYNAVFMPVALGLLIMMGIGPVIPWRKASVQNLKKHFMWPVVIGFLVTVLFFILGMRNIYALAGVFVVSFVAPTILLDYGHTSLMWTRRMKVNIFQGLTKAFTQQQRRYAGLVTHFGVLFLVAGIIAST